MHWGRGRGPVGQMPHQSMVLKNALIKVFKSSGPNNIPNRVIKDFAFELADPISHLNIWEDGVNYTNF
jgi:hypothetical protein